MLWYASKPFIYYNTLKTVVSSSAKAETGGSFKNAQNIIPLKNILETVYLHQQPTKGSPIITDNLTSKGILTHFYKNLLIENLRYEIPFLEDCIFQKHIQLIWKRGMTWYIRRCPPRSHALVCIKTVYLL